MIHYHGTPLTPRSALMTMAGKNFCVSFADPRDGDWCLAHGQSVMWDNGAFSAYTKGVELDVAAYYRWLEPRLGGSNWAVIPDVIDGTIDQQRDLIATWPFGEQWGYPVWHTGLAIDWLLDLADKFPRVCFGSSGRYWKVGSPDWCRRTDEAFNALAQRHRIIPPVHMLRGLALAGDRWPFASADSVNVARNHKDTHTDPERMARRIDAIQCPVLWTPQPVQKDMLVT